MSVGRLASSHCSETRPLGPAATFSCACPTAFMGLFFAKQPFHLSVIFLSCSLSFFLFFLSIHRQANLYRGCCGVMATPFTVAWTPSALLSRGRLHSSSWSLQMSRCLRIFNGMKPPCLSDKVLMTYIKQMAIKQNKGCFYSQYSGEGGV